MDGKPTVETFLEILLPKIESEIPADTTPTEAASILLGVERGFREAFANGSHAEEAKESFVKAAATEARRDERGREIFRNFRDATVALMDYEYRPEGVDAAVAQMVDYFANELDGVGDFDGDHVRRVMTRVFGLDDTNEEEAQNLAPAPGPYKE